MNKLDKILDYYKDKNTETFRMEFMVSVCALILNRSKKWLTINELRDRVQNLVDKKFHEGDFRGAWWRLIERPGFIWDGERIKHDSKTKT